MSGALAQRNQEPQRFFRKKLTVADIAKAAGDKNILAADDDSIIYDDDLDVSAGCSESCEVYSDADEEATKNV